MEAYKRSADQQMRIPDHGTPGMGQRKRGGVASTLGGILAGFDQAVLRTTPPAHEMVEHARPDAPVPAEDGGVIVIRLPAPAREPDGGDVVIVATGSHVPPAEPTTGR
jgi:hypothetical protein